MLEDAPSAQNPVEDDLPRPPRGRRSSTRPAGPPADVPAPQQSPAVADSPMVSEPETSAAPETAAAPAVKRTTRARSTTPRTRRSPAKKTTDETASDQSSAGETRTGDEDTSSEAVVETPETPARPRRTTRARKPAAQPATRDATEQGDADIVTPESEEEPASTSASATRRTSTGRLRRRTPATPIIEDQVGPQESTDPGPTASDPADPVAAALSAVEAGARTKPRRASRKAAEQLIGSEVPTKADGEVDTVQVLASLAAAIAAGPSGTVPQEVDEPVDEAVEEQGEEEPADTDEATDETDTPESEQAPETAETSDDLAVAVVADDESGEEAQDAEATDDSEEESTAPRRRRRRGGRRRRRGSQDQGAEEAGEPTDVATGEGEPDTEDAESGEADTNEAGESGTGARRRRRRRRSGSSGGEDESGEAIKVREPRKLTDEITGIEGSTRLEAKKQRRREGRAAGRHRAPILTEAEFLARRESVERTMLVRQREEYTQLAVLEDGVLVEHYVDRASSTSLIGSIYLGRVQNVLPSMEAVFIDIGRGRNAVLYAGEVDWDQFNVSADARKVEQVFKSGQTVLVQVSKDPVGAKGARLTGHLSIPGRYVVYSPGGHLSGISRKLPDQERRRLKSILDEVVAPEASVIVRTAAEGATQEELVADVERLKAQWEAIEKKSKQGGAPQLLYSEPDLTLRIIRDTFTEDFTKLVISGLGGPRDAWTRISEYLESVAPNLSDRLEHWGDNDGDPFVKFRIEEQILKGLERKVFLPSGGSLVIDRTEAMTVIDVNTGKFTGSGGNLEETVTRNNLEAAEEIVRQLRLRDLGGIIVVDFIDMVLPSNRELLLRRLVECLGRDRTRHQVSEVTSLGLVQLTRKRIGTGLAEAFTDTCDHCGGRGYIRHDDPVESQAPADGGERHGKSHSKSRRKASGTKTSTEDKSGSQANQVKPSSEEVKQATAKLAAAAARHHAGELEAAPVVAALPSAASAGTQDAQAPEVVG